MWRWDRYYAPAKPLKTRGGIKSQSKGSFGKSWWAKRWIAVLESMSLSNRLSRGRAYAKKGQVLDVKITKGKVTARVQGTARNPYSIKIEVATLSENEWKKVAEELSRQAVYMAKLMAGEMPEDIEKVFEKASLFLFPRKRKDLSTHCSCPDSANPCKHVAAVYYLLGEEFDRDPFLIFKMRGIEKREFLEALGIHSGRKEEHGLPRERLPEDPISFWRGKEPPSFTEVEIGPPIDGVLLKQLGKFPLWQGEENWLETLLPVYRNRSEKVNPPRL